MDLAQLANIGEFIGGLAVIASLIFVGVQIRQNTKTALRANARQAATQNVSALRAMIDQPDLFSDPDDFGFGARDTLSPSARLRFDLSWAIWLQAAEQLFADEREGLLEYEYKEPYMNVLRAVLSLPGGRDYWEDRRVWFSRSFQAEIDALIGDAADT